MQSHRKLVRLSKVQFGHCQREVAPSAVTCHELFTQSVLSTKGTNKVPQCVRTFQETFKVIYTKYRLLVYSIGIRCFNSPPHILRRSTILAHMF